MSKSYYSLGLMSGTSMDGVDASVIQSDGKSIYKSILDKYFKYPKTIYNNLTTLRDKIKSSKDLKKHQKQIKSVEKEITIFHAKAANKILKKTKINVNFIGFHGQTIFHNVEKKITKQLGDGRLLSKLTKKKVVYDFRQNDLKNGGGGAPLTPIFHKMLAKKINLKNVVFINIGGIINATTINDDGYFEAQDIGPGMCLIDKWIRTNSKKKYDDKGKIAKTGKINKKISNKAVNNYLTYHNKYVQKTGKEPSLDIKDFENFNILHPKFLKDLSLEDGAATLTEFTFQQLDISLFQGVPVTHTFILCGGGRKNNFLVEKISRSRDGTSVEEFFKVILIDKYGIDGDFVESQAFAYLAIRSYLKLPISFPETTGCSKLCTGGVLIKNF